MDTLGSLLPKKQAKMLTKKVRRMTKEELEAQSHAHPKSDLSYKDLNGLRNVAIQRINSGDTIFTYSNHDFSKKDPQDPSTCSTF